MSNVTLERIMGQMRGPRPSIVPTPAAQQAIDAVRFKPLLSPPIDIDELRQVLMAELGIVEVPTLQEDKSHFHFESIYDFVQWYSSVQDKFSGQQRTALDTLVQVRSLIERGCACKRSSREVQAHNYFNTFWTQNKKTDLLSTIAHILGAERVSISNICSFPNTMEVPR